jgi:hypothetical protein
MVLRSCPECDGDVEFRDESKLGYKVILNNCFIHLIILYLQPIELHCEYEENRIRFGEKELDF